MYYNNYSRVQEAGLHILTSFLFENIFLIFFRFISLSSTLSDKFEVISPFFALFLGSR